MLEIYKETLNDLLSMHRTDLKIKESPIKGIYVEGLTQMVFYFLKKVYIVTKKECFKRRRIIGYFRNWRSN